MLRRVLPIPCFLLLLAGCKAREDSSLKAIVGAVLIDGTGGPPISGSVVTIEGSRIRAVGTRAALPVPPAAETIDGSGKFLVPGLIDLQARLDSSAGRAGIERALDRYLRSGVSSVRAAATPAGIAVRQAERQGALSGARLFLAGRAANPGEVPGLAAQQVDAIEAEADRPAALEDILDQSRRFRIPVFAGAFTLAAARLAVDNGAAGLLHMIGDTDALDPAFIARLRDLRTVVAPALARVDAAQFALAKRNTKSLADGGVLMAVASGGDTLREMELLSEAGLPPAGVLAAATRNGALALGQIDRLGTIEPGKSADLLLLSANPEEDVRNWRKIDRVMRDGQWIGPGR
jgi:imidazolonepropionase-like amidohydrolase